MTLLCETWRYRPHILCGAHGHRFTGRRESGGGHATYHAIHPWYSTWVIRSGAFTIREDGQRAETLHAPIALLMEPGCGVVLEIPPAVEYGWLEWGVSAARLVPRLGSEKGWRYPDSRTTGGQHPQPGARETWGIDMPRCVPVSYWGATVQAFAEMTNDWWRGGLRRNGADACLSLWLNRLVRMLSPEEDAGRAIAPMDSPWGQMVEGRLREGLDQVLTVRDAAARVGMAEHRFRKQCRAETGMQAKVYLDRIKLDAAMMLLRRGDSDMIRISRLCGFASRVSFTRWFGRQTGVSPSLWKSQAEKDPSACEYGNGGSNWKRSRS